MSIKLEEEAALKSKGVYNVEINDERGNVYRPFVVTILPLPTAGSLMDWDDKGASAVLMRKTAVGHEEEE